MRLLRLALVVAVACAAFAIDVGESARTASISIGAAHAKRHHRHHRRKHHKRRHHTTPPATEM